MVLDVDDQFLLTGNSSVEIN